MESLVSQNSPRRNIEPIKAALPLVANSFSVRKVGISKLRLRLIWREDLFVSRLLSTLRPYLRASHTWESNPPRGEHLISFSERQSFLAVNQTTVSMFLFDRLAGL